MIPRQPTHAVAPLLLLLLLLTMPVLPAVASDKPAPKPAAKTIAGVATEAASAASAGSGKTAPAGLAEDPMERLRQRLAQRLGAPGSAPAVGTLDLHVSTTRATAPAAARHAAAAVPSGHGAAAGPAPMTVQAVHATPAAPMRQVAATMHALAPAAAPSIQARRDANVYSPTGGHAHARWGYEGAAGPAAWGGLRPDFGLCANGQRQSPIDIRGGLAVDLDPVKFDYRASNFSVVDNGHTVQVNMPPGNAIEIGGRRYELVQFHFHRPSEERIDGRQFEMSLHLVHKDPSGKLAVVGVLLAKGPAHPAVQAVWNNLPLERHEDAPARTQLDPTHLLPGDKRYFTYMGSLTTPPCSEGVLWVVMRTPVTMTDEQLELFARIYPMNARPAQPVAGRRIMQSQ